MIQIGKVSGKGKSRRRERGQGGPGSRCQELGPGGLVRAERVAQESPPCRTVKERRLRLAEPEVA